MAKHGHVTPPADGHPEPAARRRGPLFAVLAVLLTVAGVALLAVGCSASRPGPPQPPASAAGSIGSASVRSTAPQELSMSPGSGAVGVTPKPRSSASPEAVGAPTGVARSTAHTPAPTTTASTGPASTGPASTAPTTSRHSRATTSGRQAASSTAAAPRTRPTITGPVLPYSAPVELSVPAIGVHSPLLKLGLNSDGTVQVPSLNDPDSKAGWYDRSPAPGTAGPAVILGHVDSAKYGPGVFYRLGDLRPGNHIDVTRADGTVAVFRVDAVRSYSKSDFPTLQVYGNIDHAGLRLITCGGEFDYSERSYENNIVVFASLQSSHRSS